MPAGEVRSWSYGRSKPPPPRGALIGVLDLLVRRRAVEIEPERHLAADAILVASVWYNSPRHRDAGKPTA